MAERQSQASEAGALGEAGHGQGGQCLCLRTAMWLLHGFGAGKG